MAIKKHFQGEEAQLPMIVNGVEAVTDDEEYFDDKITQDHMRFCKRWFHVGFVRFLIPLRSVLYLVSLYSKPAEHDEEVLFNLNEEKGHN